MSTKPYELQGSDLGIVYHAGKVRIEKVNPKKLQASDEGWYGKGFYVGRSPELVKSYGPVISVFRIKDDARVLKASINIADVPKQLVNDIRDWLAKFPYIKDQDNPKQIVKDEVNLWKVNQVEWLHRVDQWADEQGYDAIWWLDSEIVIKTPRKLIPVMGLKQIKEVSLVRDFISLLLRS